MKAPLFQLGQIMATPGAIAAMNRATFHGEQLLAAAMLDRHMTGDWGEIDAHDRGVNEEALTLGNRILSAYDVSGTRYWVITEADRSSTTILLPEEY